jgi:hypothetical protein
MRKIKAFFLYISALVTGGAAIGAVYFFYLMARKKVYLFTTVLEYESFLSKLPSNSQLNIIANRNNKCALYFSDPIIINGWMIIKNAALQTTLKYINKVE